MRGQFMDLGTAPVGMIDGAAEKAIEVASLLYSQGWGSSTVCFDFNDTRVYLDHKDSVEDVVRRYNEQRRLLG